MSRRIVAMLLSLLLAGAAVACASPGKSTADGDPEGYGAATTQAAAAGRESDAYAGAPPGPLLVDVTDSGQSLRMRPVDPVTLADLPGYAPLDAGHHATHAVSPDGRTLAAITWPSGSHNSGGDLHLLDLPSWSTRTLDLTFDDHVGQLTFGPYGKALYWLKSSQTDPSHGMPRDYRLYRYVPGAVELPPLTDLAALPSSFVPYEMRFLRSGDRLAVYGIPTDTNNLAEDAPHVLLIDVANGRIAADVRLDGVTAGQFRAETEEGERGYEMYNPGLAWDLESDRLYVVHADEDRATAVDLAGARVIEQRDIRPEESLWDRLWDWLVPTAEAKMAPGTTRQAVLSSDGSRLYVTGVRQEMEQQPDGRWVWREVPLGLQVIATEDLTELRRFDLPVSGAALSPDGQRLLLVGRSGESIDGEEPTGEYSGVYVLDGEGLEELAHLQEGVDFRVLGFSEDGRYAYLSHVVSFGDYQTYEEALQVLDLASLRFVAERRGQGFTYLLPVAGSRAGPQ